MFIQNTIYICKILEQKKYAV